MLAIVLLFPRPALATPVIKPDIPAYVKLVGEINVPVPDFDKEILEPLKAKQQEIKAKEESEALRAAQEAARQQLPKVVDPQSYAAPSAPKMVSGGLTGSIGYARAGGNCILEPGINNPHNGTNPISWALTSRTPWIGATALFYFNHAAVVTGVWGNGDVEVRHQNAPGAPHRYPASMIRGYR